VIQRRRIARIRGLVTLPGISVKPYSEINSEEDLPYKNIPASACQGKAWAKNVQ